jgi:2'-5' RNA ligase
MPERNVYVVTIDFELAVAPAWLADFRKKYDKQYVPHVTLKNLSYITAEQIPELEIVLQGITKKYEPMAITFSAYSFSTTKNGHVIMALAEKNDELFALQKDVRESCAHFGEHTRTDFKEYETNFTPHLTIGRELTDEQFAEAKHALSEQIECRATLSTVSLIVYDSLAVQERMGVPMKKFFQLGR